MTTVNFIELTVWDTELGTVYAVCVPRSAILAAVRALEARSCTIRRVRYFSRHP